MAQNLAAAQRRGAKAVEEFNSKFTPNTPCFVKPMRNEDKWYPTRTRSEAWQLGHGAAVVQVDGASGCVPLEHLSMPGSKHYEEAVEEADLAQWANNAPDPVENETAPAPITLSGLTDQMYTLLLNDGASASVLNIVSEYKRQVAELQEAGKISDGYHTFDELYQHRVRLFTCLMHAHKNRAWWSHKHSDGSQWDGWIIAGILTPRGMVSYHLPVTEVEHLPEGIELEEGRLWDGHTAEDVLKRLPSLNFGQTDGTALAIDTPVGEQAIYQYAVAVNTPRGELHMDGTLQGPMIESHEDYLRYRAEMASDVGVTPEQIQVRSLSIIGVVPAAHSEADHGSEEDA